MPSTVKVTLDTAIAELPSILATKHGMVVKTGASSDDIRFKPNGTGPFTLKELKLGELKTTFNKNANYWRPGLPKSDCLTVTAITEPISRVAALKSGEADIVLVVDPATIGTLKEDPNITLTKAPGGTAVTMGFFIDKPPFDNPKVREAMKLVIDRQAIVDTALLGFGIPGNDNPILPTSPDAYRSDIKQRDVAKAKQLLAEAGHPDGISVDSCRGSDARHDGDGAGLSADGVGSRHQGQHHQRAGRRILGYGLAEAALRGFELGHADDTGRPLGRLSQEGAVERNAFLLATTMMRFSTRRQRPSIRTRGASSIRKRSG